MLNLTKEQIETIREQGLDTGSVWELAEDWLSMYELLEEVAVECEDELGEWASVPGCIYYPLYLQAIREIYKKIKELRGK